MSTTVAPTIQPLPLPAPRVPVTVRPATADDLPFIDALQKKNTKAVGFMPAQQLAQKVAAGHVLIAECRLPTAESGSQSEIGDRPSAVPAGYLIGHDQYFKHDDVGIIYQVNVAPAYRRSLVAATLLQAQFDRSAYGCKLYCCWCAQDLDANRFWESMGFVPLAFRTGALRRSPGQGGRTHIFWQKRIRQGDVTTPWWFPSKTAGGSIRADRIVLPIPPGVRWDEEMPRVPGVSGAEGADGNPKLEDRSTNEARIPKPQTPTRGRGSPSRPSFGPPPSSSSIAAGGVRFALPTPAVVAKPKPEPKPQPKADPKLAAAARELRDRWLDEVNAGRYLPATAAKYDLARALEYRPAPVRLLPAA